MSQNDSREPTHSDSVPASEKQQCRYMGRRFEEQAQRGYRQVNRMAVASLTMGVLSILTMFGWAMVAFPIIGISLGFFALRQIRFSTGEMTGKKMAISGIACSVGLSLLGLGFLVLIAFNEVPLGYHELTFLELQPDEENEGELIPKEILDLEGKNIYLTGYMYPGSRLTGIQEFILVPTLQHCKFCARQLKSTEMVKVRTVGDVLFDFSNHPIGVGGKLRIDPNEAMKPLGGMPYLIEADYSYR